MTTLEQRRTLGYTLRAIATILVCFAVAGSAEVAIIAVPVLVFGWSLWIDVVTVPIGCAVGMLTLFRTARALLPLGEPLEPWGEMKPDA